MSWDTRIFSRMISYSNEILSSDNYTVGIERVSSGGGTGTWRYIDSAGNVTKIPTGYFKYHPVFSNMKSYTIDGQEMISIPKFYVKQLFTTYSDESEASNNTTVTSYKIWITYVDPDDSDGENTVKQQGFHLHPAFYNNGSKISGDKIYVGAYQASLDDASNAKPKACSVGSTRDSSGSIVTDGGKYPTTNRSFNFWLDACKARNEDGNDNLVWHMMTIYEYSALQLLFLIENCTTDTQKLYGTGNCDSIGLTYVDEDDSELNPVFHGINSLWGNASQMVDGIMIDKDNIINVWKNTGNTASNYFNKDLSNYINTGKTAYSKTESEVSSDSSSQWRYYSEVYVNDDLNNLFIPNSDSIVASNKNSTYADGVYPVINDPSDTENKDNHFCAVGGDFTSAEYGGIFCIRMNIDYGKSDDYEEKRTNNLSSCTTRLCKY